MVTYNHMSSFCLVFLFLNSFVVTFSYGQAAVDCAACIEDAAQVVKCSIDNECNYEECITTKSDDESIVNAILNCCDGVCSDSIETTMDCVNDCLPCLEETTVSYFSCVNFNPYNCDTTCNETLSEYYDTATTTTANGEDVFTILQDLEDLDGTCDSIKDEIETEVCNVANCCSYCVDEFEEVAECATQLFTSDGCDIECGTNEEWKPNRGGGGRRRNKQRNLQTPPSDLPNVVGGGGNGVDGPPDFSQVEVPGPI